MCDRIFQMNRIGNIGIAFEGDFDKKTSYAQAVAGLNLSLVDFFAVQVCLIGRIKVFDHPFAFMNFFGLPSVQYRKARGWQQ